MIFEPNQRAYSPLLAAGIFKPCSENEVDPERLYPISLLSL